MYDMRCDEMRCDEMRCDDTNIHVWAEGRMGMFRLQHEEAMVDFSCAISSHLVREKYRSAACGKT